MTVTFVILAKIGVFMTFTAAWSYVSAQTVLPALLATFGPYGKRGGGITWKQLRSPRSWSPRFTSKQSSSSASVPVPANATELSATSNQALELNVAC